MLAVPTTGSAKPENRPTASLNQSSVTQRPALGKKQVAALKEMRGEHGDEAAEGVA